MRTFHSKVGWWYWAVIILCSCLLFVLFWIHQLLLTLLFALVVIFEIEMLIHTQYVVQSEEGILSIQTGRFLKGASIPIETIVSIETSHSLESAPALSLSRLKIVYRKGKVKTYVLVSPKNPEDFVKVLSRLNPSIIVNI